LTILTNLVNFLKMYPTGVEMAKLMGKIGTIIGMTFFLVYGILTLSLPVEAGVLCLSQCVNERENCNTACNIGESPGMCHGFCVVKYEICVIDCGGFEL